MGVTWISGWENNYQTKDYLYNFRLTLIEHHEMFHPSPFLGSYTPRQKQRKEVKGGVRKTWNKELRPAGTETPKADFMVPLLRLPTPVWKHMRDMLDDVDSQCEERS